MIVRTPWSCAGGELLDVENPATRAVVGTVQCASPDTVDAAVKAAQAAFAAWAAIDPSERGQVLARIADAIAVESENLALLESQENGKPIDQARGDVAACVGSFRFFAEAAATLHPGSRPGGPVDLHVFLEPYGVVAAIIPFNWPPIHFGAKVAPALAVGNAVVLKPGEQAPLTVMRLAEIVGALLPPGLLHVVPGRGDVGAALSAHPLVRKLSFTGAPETGRRVLASIAPNLTPALMELGGKNPLIVFEDADLDRVAADFVEATYYNKGEACTAASRILIQRPIYPQLVALLARRVEALVSGDPLAATTHVGPCVDERQAKRVREYLAIGEGEGARVAGEGALPDDPRLAHGHFVAPVLLADVLPSMRVAQEEIFGPVGVAIAFDDEADAISIANGTEFGLVAAIYSQDDLRVQRVVRQVEAGVIFVNNYWRGLIGTPFGGTKASGYGREHATETLREFGYLKAVRRLTSAPLPRWPQASELA